jgi:hypothetical protein
MRLGEIDQRVGDLEYPAVSSAIRLLKHRLKEDKSLTGDIGRFVIYYIFRYDPALH